MKTVALMLLSLAVGWFVHDACVTAIERIYDWRTPAKWALFAVIDIAAVLILFP